MIAGLDSSYFRPSVAQLTQARASGVRIWGGYLTTKPNVGIASPWDQASFERVRAVLGTTPIAWASGWDDPVACRQKAAAWNVRLGLDDESGIRIGLSPTEEQHIIRRIANRGPRRLDGSWVQPWLDASGAGLYGNAPVFNGRHAPFFVIAAYPSSGNPGRTWPAGATPPQVPCGWQWQGTHDEFGGGVDRGNYDDWFSQGDDFLSALSDAEQRELLSKVRDIENLLIYSADLTGPDGKPLHPSIAVVKDVWNELNYDVKPMLAQVQSPDIPALAAAIVAKLPPGTASLDDSSAATLAKRVVEEIGRVWPRPAV